MSSVEQMSAVGQVLVDPGQDLTRRFRALFTLRNLGGNALINYTTIISMTAFHLKNKLYKLYWWCNVYLEFGKFL